MADRQTAPKQEKTLAAKAALFVLAAIVAAPALATTSSRIPCSEAIEATLNVPVNALITASVSHDIPTPSSKEKPSIDEITVVSAASLLAPRAEAAIRDAFEESDRLSIDSPDANVSRAVLAPPMAGTESKADTTDDNGEGGPVSGMNTRLPGVSDDLSSRYKMQMFRRDI
jgi:hypothetical protein